ncbi:MAG: Uma2 family endonuclease [Planctomycetales bacterium]|nr:Uma2 family endonuclease [Planctomycetales bacterium]
MSIAESATVAAFDPALPSDWTLADLQRHLGDIPPERIRLFPSPGLATEQDALDWNESKRGLCELVDRVLVDKAMGLYESVLAGLIVQALNNYLADHPLGIVTAPDGPFRLSGSLVRLPDVAFVRWERLPGRKLPSLRVFAGAPDLAIEILSPSNRPAEMHRKLVDYFEAGVRLVWYIHPEARQATIYTAVEQAETIDDRGLLVGGDVLPGFELNLGELLDRVPSV